MPEEIPVFTVRDLKALEAADNGRAFIAVLVVRKLQAKTASNGNTYHSVDLGDRGGVFSCTVFGDSPVSEVLRAAGEGAVVRIEGKVEFYQGRFSPRLHRATPLDEDALAAGGIEKLLNTGNREGFHVRTNLKMRSADWSRWPFPIRRQDRSQRRRVRIRPPF